jgi:hypothetical protein
LQKTSCTPDRLLFQPYSRAFRSWKEIAEALVEDPDVVFGGYTGLTKIVFLSFILKKGKKIYGRD